MRRRVFWITFLTTMVFWFGRAWAADPISDDMDLMRMLEGLRPSTQPSSGMVTTTQTSPTVEYDQPTTKPAVTIRYLGASTPSLNGLDRSQWALTVVPVDRGYTGHGPVYFKDLNLSAWGGDAAQNQGTVTPGTVAPFSDAQAQYTAAMGIKPAPMTTTPDVTALPEIRLEEALHGGNAVFADGENVAGLFLQPIKFAGDLIMLPIMAIGTPPWSHTTTPLGPSGTTRVAEQPMPGDLTPMLTPSGR